VLKAPSDMQGAGRFALLKDPQGATFAIIDPENARPDADGVPALGTFSWHELATTDNEAAFAFYSGLFGWDAITRMDMGPTGVYLIFGQNGKQRGGMYIKPNEMPAPPHWMPYAHVPNADKGFGIAKSSGAQQLVAPMDVPGGSRIASVIDPAGAMFAIHSMPAAPKADAAAPAEKLKAKPVAPAKAPTKPKAKAKAKAKAKVKAKTSPKPKMKSAVKRKPAAKNKVVKKAASKTPKKKSAKKSARRKK
jgi:predicted enzyme related to lactoylglutathione lyase